MTNPTAEAFGLRGETPTPANLLPSHYYLDAVRDYIASIVYASDEAIDALTATLAVTHIAKAFRTWPRFLATAEQAETGKSTLAEQIPMILAYNPNAVGRLTTEPALTSMFNTRDKPTLICDDIGKVFGDAGTNGKMTKLYAILVTGYTKNATTDFSVNRVMVKLPIGSVAFMNGLHNAVPDDLFTRCIHVKMKARPDSVKLRDALDPSVEAEGYQLREALHNWATSVFDEVREASLNGLDHFHPKLTDRKRQIWGGPIAVAKAAGGTWPDRMRKAFVKLALDNSETPSLTAQQQLLLDAADMIMRHGVDRILTVDLITGLKQMADRDFYRNVSNEYMINSLFPAVLGTSGSIRAKVLFGPDAGAEANAKGRMAFKILQDAADLRHALHPELEDIDKPNQVDDELALSIVTPVTGVTA